MSFEEKLMPIEEILREGEFTGRVEILRDLEQWIELIKIAAAGSQALIAPRRMGKTVLLDRLVNIVFFKPEYKVVTFYLKFTREEITLRKFLLKYATEFFRQYIAYCLQDVGLYKDKNIELLNLLEIKHKNKPVKVAQKYIESSLTRYNKDNYEDARNHWDDFITVPELVASESGIRVAIIIDEFQDMKFYVFDTTEEGIDRLRTTAPKNYHDAAVDLTSTFSHQALSKKASMLVSGSAVTLIFKTVMGGPLGGRFGFMYLKPLSLDEGATLMSNLVKIYTRNLTITPDMAFYASTQVTGHPYYLWCLATSAYEDKIFDSPASIDKLIEFEIKSGKIFGFWETHFHVNKEYINNDNDKEIGKKIIYYFTKYNNQPVQIDEIAQKIGISKVAVEEKIEKLYLADLVYKTKFKNYTFNDICLMRYIQYRYENDLKDVEKIDLSEKNKFNFLKGKFLELVIMQLFYKFNLENIDGKIFGKNENVIVPTFASADTRFTKAEKTDAFQIDVFAQQKYQRVVWLCECKYKKVKMTLDEVKKLESARDAFLQQELQETPEDEEPIIPQVVLWYISTGGFTDDAIDYIKDRENVYYTDYDGVNSLFRMYGGGFDIPMFSKE